MYNVAVSRIHLVGGYKQYPYMSCSTIVEIHQENRCFSQSFLYLKKRHNQVLIGRDSIPRVVICTKVNIRVRGWNLKQIDSCTFVAVKASATITCAVIVLMPPIARRRWNGDSYRAQSKFCCMTATEIWDQQESPVCARRNILHTLREEEGTRKSCSGI